MSIEALAPYSPTTVYGQLTSPFTPKTITINSHTPYDKSEKTDSDVYNSGYFDGKPQVKNVYNNISVQSEYDSDFVKFSENLSSDNIPTNVQNFSSSELSSKDIVKNSLNKGYSTQEALVIQRANVAYQKSAFLTNNPVGVLSTFTYSVK